MHEDERTPSIRMEPLNFIDRTTKQIEDKFKLELDKIRLEILALRNEFKKAADDVSAAKKAADEHFTTINNLQAKIDKERQLYATRDDVDNMIKLALANHIAALNKENSNSRSQVRDLRAAVVLVGGLLIAFFLFHITGRI